MANKKIICIIDYWTLGFEKNLMPLVSKLDESKFDVVLVHFSSISHNPYGHRDQKISYIKKNISNKNSSSSFGNS